MGVILIPTTTRNVNDNLRCARLFCIHNGYFYDLMEFFFLMMNESWFEGDARYEFKYEVKINVVLKFEDDRRMEWLMAVLCFNVL